LSQRVRRVLSARCVRVGALSSNNTFSGRVCWASNKNAHKSLFPRLLRPPTTFISSACEPRTTNHNHHFFRLSHLHNTPRRLPTTTHCIPSTPRQRPTIYETAPPNFKPQRSEFPTLRL